MCLGGDIKVGVNFSDIPFDTELDPRWSKRRDFGSFAVRVLPWLAGAAVFIIVGTTINLLQFEWEGSPVFFLVRQIGRGLIAVVELIIGTVFWLVTGDAVVVKNIPEVVSGLWSANSACPLVFGLMIGRFAFRVFRYSQLSSKTGIRLFVVAVFVVLVAASLTNAATERNWLYCTYNTVISFWEP